MKRDRVAVIIPTRRKVEMVEECLGRLFASVDEENIALEVVVVEHGGRDSEELIKEKFAEKPVVWQEGEEDWSYSEMNNAGVERANLSQHGLPDFYLFLNNDCFASDGFLETMLEVMGPYEEHDQDQEWVGVVGPKLLHTDGRIQSIGTCFDRWGIPYHLGHGKPGVAGQYLPAMRDDDFDAITFACVLIRRECLEETGQLDPAYFFNYEDVDWCLRAREEGWKIRFCHRAVLRHGEGESGEFRKTQKHSLGRNLEIFKKKWIDTGRLEEVTGSSVKVGVGPLAQEHLNLLFVPPSRALGAGWWRIHLPASKIANKKLANVEVLYGDVPLNHMVGSIEQADAVIFHSWFSTWCRNIAEMGIERRAAFIYDYDDHPIHLSVWAGVYRGLGAKERKMIGPNGKPFWLWRDGEGGFDIERNILAKQNLMEIMQMSDMLTTSVGPLHEYFSSFHGSVAMLQNMIDFDLFQHQYSLWQRRPGPVRIGWHGGDNHFHDMCEIGEPLAKFVNENDVQLVMFGAYYKGALKGIDESKVVRAPWIDIHGFPYRLATLGIDVAVIPLADPSAPDMKFNHYKSDIKFCEYGALRTPSLVSEGRAAYATCQDGENALTFASQEEFTEKLAELVGDQVLRERIGNGALDWVHEFRDLDKNIHLWIDSYTQAISGYGDRVMKAKTTKQPQAAEG